MGMTFSEGNASGEFDGWMPPGASPEWERERANDTDIRNRGYFRTWIKVEGGPESVNVVIAYGDRTFKVVGIITEITGGMK